MQHHWQRLIARHGCLDEDWRAGPPTDGAVIEHFKAKAGERGYQTLINEALKQAIQSESIEGVVRKTIREELRRA